MDELVTRLARAADRRYYGKYRGFVTANDDPEMRGRLRVCIPSVLGTQATGWALPCLAFGGLANQGVFAVPEVNAQVWVEFEEGDINRPIWVGTFWQQSSDVPQPAAISPPTTRLLRTNAGHLIQLDDAPGSERMLLQHPAGAEISIDPSGTVMVKDAGGGSVTLDAQQGQVVVKDGANNSIQLGSNGVSITDANNNRIEMTASGVTLQAACIVLDAPQVMLGGQGGEMAVKGLTLATLLGTHVHGTSFGPTSPPLPPADGGSLPTQVLSIGVTVK